VPPAASELAADAVLADGTTVRIHRVRAEDRAEPAGCPGTLKAAGFPGCRSRNAAVVPGRGPA